MISIVDAILTDRGLNASQLVIIEQMSSASDVFVLRRITQSDKTIEFSISRKHGTERAAPLTLIQTISGEDIALHLVLERPMIPALLKKYGHSEFSAEAGALMLSPLSLIDSKPFRGGRMWISGGIDANGKLSNFFELVVRFDDGIEPDQVFALDENIVAKSILDGSSALRESLIATPSAVRAIASKNTQTQAMLEKHDIDHATPRGPVHERRKRSPSL